MPKSRGGGAHHKKVIRVCACVWRGVGNRAKE